jgi:putative SOS response-associated peptidase YedK
MSISAPAHAASKPDAVGQINPLWTHNSTIGITSCTILTTAQEPIIKLHDCQPVILDPAAYDAWLGPSTSSTEARSLLARNLEDGLEFHRVSRQVNSYKFEGEAAAIVPINPL